MISKVKLIALLGVSGLFSSCVSKQTHLQTVVELEQSRRQIAESELKWKLLQDKHDLLQQDNKALKQDQEALKAKIGQLEGQIASLNREVLNSKQSLANATSQIANLSKEREELRATVAQTQDQLKSEQAASVKARELSDQQMAALQRERTSLTEANVIVAKSRAELQAKIQELQQALQAAQEDVGSYKRALDEGKSRRQSADNEKQQLVESLADTRTTLRDLEKKLAAEQANLAQARQALEEHTKNSRSALQAADGLQQQLQTVQQAHAKDKQSLEEATRHLAMLNDQIEKEKGRTDTLAAQIVDRDKEIGRLREASADREALSV